MLKTFSINFLWILVVSKSLHWPAQQIKGHNQCVCQPDSHRTWIQRTHQIALILTSDWQGTLVRAVKGTICSSFWRDYYWHLCTLKYVKPFCHHTSQNFTSHIFQVLILIHLKCQFKLVQYFELRSQTASQDMIYFQHHKCKYNSVRQTYLRYPSLLYGNFY